MINEVLFSSESENWSTPQDVFDKLDRVFHFTLDPCASPENTKCKKYYTKETDGLTRILIGTLVDDRSFICSAIWSVIVIRESADRIVSESMDFNRRNNIG